jgi:starch phosphorylase
LFGLTAAEVAARKAAGYVPREVVEADPELRAVIERLSTLVPGDPDVFAPLVHSLIERDEFLVLADFRAYSDAQREVDRAWRDTAWWTRASILNTARCGFFSSDRAIHEYCRDLWRVEPVPV